MISGGLAGAIELDGDATEVTVSIADANGKTLKTVNLGAQSQGTLNYDWDGTADDGDHDVFPALRHGHQRCQQLQRCIL